MTIKPTYEELANAFAEYLACSNNQGEAVAASDEDVERAQAVVDAAEGRY